jgi:peptidoglycan glycosyltransferase
VNGSKQIRNLGVFLVVIYVALFLQVNRITVFEAGKLQENPGNNREIRRDFDSPRGSVTTADGVLLAQSEEAEPGGRFERQRVFPQGDTYGHITGYYSFSNGAAGLEDTYNDVLAGRDLDFDLQDIGDFFVDRERVGNLTLSVRDDVQRTAREALGDREGSVIALDPRTGAVLAMWSFPSYDPNPLSVHDQTAAAAANQALNADEENPKLSRAYQQIFFPGSTFKVVTATAGVELAGVTPDQPDYPEVTGYRASENGRELRNFDGNSCGGTLFIILQRSCNSSFAQMGVEQVGGDGMVETAEAFGFNEEVPFDLPGAATSVFPRSITNPETGEETRLDQNRGVLAQLSIGQNGVSATPMQMALVAAAVANDGVIMTPYVVQEVRDDQDEVVEETEPDEWRTAMSGATSATLREAMVSVVDDGSAVRLDDELPDSYVVGGKTGTAQLGTDPPRSHTWIIGFAGPPNQPAEVAVAVIVEGQEGASESTGGEVAAPIAGAVLGAALEGEGAPPGDDEGDGEG